MSSQPPGHDSFLASQQNALAQGQAQQGSTTGLQNLLFIGSPKHNIGPDVQKAYWEGLIPGFKTSPFFKPGGGLNSRAKPIDMKKSGYQPPPGNAQHTTGEGAVPQSMQGATAAVINNSQGAIAGVQNHSQGALAGVQHGGESKSNAGAMQAAMASNTSQNAMAAVQSQTQHTSSQFRHMAQMGIGVNLQPYSGMDPLRQQNIFQSHLYSRMSPFDMMNYMPMNPFGAAGSMSAVQHQNQVVSAQQAAIAAQSRSPGR